MRLFKLFILNAVVLGSLFTPAALAKDLTNRLGIGYTDEFANSGVLRRVPALSAKYGLNKEIHVSGAMGFDTQSPSAFTLGGKVYRNIFYETNLNFYMAGGLALIKNDKTAFELLGLFGAEFFIPGLDSLGLLFEAGVSANDAGEDFALKTVGFSFLHAGMHFYF